MIPERFTKWSEGLKKAFQSSFSSFRRALTSLLLSLSVFSVIALASFPAYSLQMIKAGPGYWPTAIQALTFNMYFSIGFTGLALTAIFSVFTAVALLNTYISYRASSLQKGNITGIIPGILASGCASCGVGLLGVLGLAGGLSLLPFNGNLFRAGGIVLIGFFLGRNGDPEKCKI